MFNKTEGKYNTEKLARSSSIKNQLLTLLVEHKNGTYSGGGLGLTEIMQYVICLNVGHQNFLPFYEKLVAEAGLSREQLRLPSNIMTLRNVTATQLDKLVDCFTDSPYKLAFENNNTMSAAGPK